MEENREQTIERLRKQVAALQERVRYLEGTLDGAGIFYDRHCIESGEGTECTEKIQEREESQKNQGSRIISETITKDHAKFFYSMFKGRTDVYSKRAAKPNAKTGKTGYYTQCWNFWKDGLCPKKKGVQIKCADCANQRYKQLTGDDLMNHLLGAKEDCSDVIGIYPMLSNETCNFLVFDFDNHESDNLLDDDANTGNGWVEEVNSMRMICIQNDVDVLVERSRSGKGAHIWIFFAEPIPASTARKFGDALLTKGAESVNQKTFQSYDRMLPAQDHMPAGGLGNLIALPLQGKALREGNSAFIDENWNACPDQWKQLQTVKKLSKASVEEKIKAWNHSALNFLAGDLGGERENSAEDGEKEKSKPWEKKEKRFDIADVDGMLEITKANQIFVNNTNLKPRMQNQLRRLAAYSNPQYYKN